MKTISFLKNHFMLMVALLTAGVTMSFKVAESHKADTVYYYNSSDLSEGAFADVNNWATSPTFTCVTQGKRPCKMRVAPGGTLDDQIAGKTNAQVLAIHPNERRP